MTKKYKTIKEDIISLLKDKDNYEMTDDKLIDELVFNFYICDKAKKEIEEGGIMVNVVRDEKKTPLYQVNQAVGIYHQSLKYITTIFTKLGISPSERKKLKMSGEKLPDLYDMLNE